ncbi:MAG: hypothetical protein ACI9IL_000422 [Rickettsiales bacterium]|jgi:hypothetical protein
MKTMTNDLEGEENPRTPRTTEENETVVELGNVSK